MAKKPELVMSGGVKITQGPQTATRMAIFMWGLATAGKTTFAATAPGKKLWISLGDQEHVTVQRRKDVLVANYSDMPAAELFKHAQNKNPFGLDGILRDNEEIETVVLDSATSLAYAALQQAVEKGVGRSPDFTPTMEAPGQSAYGGRNAITLQVLTELLRVTAKYNVHLIITGHEADPVTRLSGGKGSPSVIDYIGVMLGGQIVNNVTQRLSEIWHLSQSDTGEKNRRLMIRATRLRRPAKTRMFTGKDVPEFDLHYDADLPDTAKGQMTITKFYEDWKAGGYEKLPIPKKGGK